MFSASTFHGFNREAELILPRRDFIFGERIPFELKFTTITKTKKLWRIGLRLDKVYSKKPKVLKSDKGFKYKFLTHTFKLKLDGWEESTFGDSFKGIFIVPQNTPPTIISFNEPILYGGELIHKIEYTLEVTLDLEVPIGPIVQAPIELGYSRKPGNDFQQPLIPANPQNETQSWTRNNQGNGSTSRLDGSRLSLSNVSRFGVNLRDQLPSYSMLSLPILPSSRSNSVQTLPPYYEDILH